MRYRVYRRLQGDATWNSLFTTSGPTTLEYNDLSVEADNIYEYCLTSLDASSNESMYSDIAVANVPSGGDPVEDSADIKLYLTDAAYPLDGSSLYGDDGHYYDFNNLPVIEPLGEGGDVVPNRPFSYYGTLENVVVFNRWGSG